MVHVDSSISWERRGERCSVYPKTSPSTLYAYRSISRGWTRWTWFIPNYKLCQRGKSWKDCRKQEDSTQILNIFTDCGSCGGGVSNLASASGWLVISQLPGTRCRSRPPIPGTRHRSTGPVGAADPRYIGLVDAADPQDPSALPTDVPRDSAAPPTHVPRDPSLLPTTPVPRDTSARRPIPVPRGPYADPCSQ